MGTAFNGDSISWISASLPNPIKGSTSILTCIWWRRNDRTLSRWLKSKMFSAYRIGIASEYLDLTNQITFFFFFFFFSFFFFSHFLGCFFFFFFLSFL